MPRDRKLYIVGIYGFAKVFPHRILQDNEKHTVSIVGDYDFSFPFYPDAYRLFDNQRYLNRLTGIGRANFAYVSKNGAMRILEDVLSAHRGLLVEHTDNKDLESVVEKLNSLYQAIFGNPPPEAHPKQPKHLSKTEKGTQQFEEGFKQEIVAEVTKRSGALVQAVKQRDNFLCQICGFDFGEFYGDYGKGFAECHHLTPVSKLEGQRFVNVDEAITVCANCHRMLHRGENLLSPDELRALIRQAQQKKTWSSWFHRTKKKGE